jgi:hypothetical protein
MMTNDVVKRRLAIAVVALEDLQSIIEPNYTWFDFERAIGLAFVAHRAVGDAFFKDLGGTAEYVAAARKKLSGGMPQLFS